MPPEKKQFVNRSHPQTLYIATILCYFEVAFSLLDLIRGGFDGGVYLLLPVAVMALLGLGAYGMANDRKVGYRLAVVGAFANFVLPILPSVLKPDLKEILASLLFQNPFNTIFAVALIALLLWPMSREYERVWFK